MLRWKVFDGPSTDAVMAFFPLNAMFKLIDEPFTRLSAVQNVANQIGEEFELDYHVHWYEMLIVLGWTAIFIYLSYALLKKRDL